MTGSLQIKSDKYYAVLNFRDQEGKRVQKWIPLNLTVKGNKRMAEALLNQLLVEYRGIEQSEPMNTLLSRHIANWIEFNRPNIAVTTYDQYVNMLRIHIAPYFDQRGITLSKLTPGDLENYYTAKVREGLNPNTVIKHHAVIRSALQWAVKHRYIRENAADLAAKPERAKYQGQTPYSIEEIAQLLTLTQHEPIAVPIFLASFYGLRRSLAPDRHDRGTGKERRQDPGCGTGEHHKDQLQQTEPASLPVHLSILLEPAAKAAGPDVPMRDQL